MFSIHRLNVMQSKNLFGGLTPGSSKKTIMSAVSVVKHHGELFRHSRGISRNFWISTSRNTQLIKYFNAVNGEDILRSELKPYKRLCTQYYDLDKPAPPANELAWLKKHLQESKRVLEPMSGSGRFLVPLKQAGIEIFGFDNSSAMIQACKEHCKKVEISDDFYSLDSFETFIPTVKFSHVMIPSGSFCLLLDQSEAKKALNNIFQWLSPGGKLIFDVEMIDSLPSVEGIPSISWVETTDKSLITLSSASRFNQSSKIQTTLNKYELWKEGKIFETELEEFKLRLYSKHEIISLVREAGFTCQSISVPYTESPAKDHEGYIQLQCVKKEQ